jgi:hypothetical protein
MGFCVLLLSKESIQVHAVQSISTYVLMVRSYVPILSHIVD